MNDPKSTPKHKTWYVDTQSLKSGSNFAQERANARMQAQQFIATLQRNQVISVCECRNDRAWDCTVWYWDDDDEQQEQA